MSEDRMRDTDRGDDTESLPLSRRGILAAGSALGLGLTAGTGSVSAESSGDDGTENSPYALKEHDHSNDFLGEDAPVEHIDVERVEADNVSTTYYADSVAELNDYLDEISDSPASMGEYNGVKIVLRRGELEATADQLPIELEGGVIIEGQGRKVTQIRAEGIGKPVFKFDRSGQKIARSVTLRDLKVIGRWVDSGLPEPGSKGVLLKNIHYWTIEDCLFVGLEDGIVVPGSWTGTISNTRIDAVSRDGIRLVSDSPMGANNIQIVNSALKGRRKNPNRYGIQARGGSSLYVAGTDISGFNENAIHTEDMKGVAIEGCHMESNGRGHDPDDDGSAEPVAIALSPNASDEATSGVAIVGNRIGYPPDPDRVGIKLNNVDSVHIVGNWNGHANRGFVELGPEISDVTIRNNSKRFTGTNHEGLIVGPGDGSNIPPGELNNGVWRVTDFANYSELATLANDHVANRYENAIEVVLSEGRSGTQDVITGADFPAGTLFRGVGSKGVQIESTGSNDEDYAVSLTKPGQRIENVVVDAAGSGIHITENAEKCSVEDVLCISQHTDIDVDGEAARLVGCDASVDTADVEQVLDLTIDSGGIPPLQTDDDDDARTVHGMTVLALYDGAGTIETTTARVYEGDDAIRVTDNSETDGCTRGAYETIDATDFEASVYINSDVNADDTKHHAQSIYLGRNVDGDHVSAGVANPGATNDPKLVLGAHGESDNYGEKPISNWAKDTWFRLVVRKYGQSVDIELLDPSDASTFASASFTLPGELDDRVGILGGFGAGQLGNLYFDEFGTSPL